jgi:hypothetical protein
LLNTMMINGSFTHRGWRQVHLCGRYFMSKIPLSSAGVSDACEWAGKKSLGFLNDFLYSSNE